MPNVNEELEQRKTTDTEEQTNESTPAHEDEDALQDVSEPVQAGNLSDSDRSKLVEDPAAEAGNSGGGGVARLKQQWEERSRNAPASPASKPKNPELEQISKMGKVKAGIQEFEARTGKKATGNTATPPASKPAEKPETESAGKKDDGNTPASPASVPPPDKYELLKRDVSSLTEEEKEKRKELIEEKYVADWKKEKEQQAKDLTEGLTDDEKSKEETRQSVDVPEKSGAEKFLEGLDTAMEVGDAISDVADAGISLGTDIADAVYTGKGKEDHKATSMTSNIAGIATGTWGTLSGGYGMFRSGQQARQKRKKGDARGAALSRFDVASNLFGTISGATGMASGIAGLKGSDASDWLGHASGIAGIGGSLTGMAKGICQRRSYGKLAERQETEDSKRKMSHRYINSREKYKQMKEAYNKGDESARSKENRMEMLKQRHDHKRSKDFMEAMDSAREHAKIKSEAGGSGILSGSLGALGGGIGLAGSFAKQFGGFGGKIAGAVLGGISSAINFSTKGVDSLAGRKEKAAGKAANDTKGKEYIEKKVASLLKKPDAQADHITEDEAKLIVAKRLGVDNPSDYSEIYKKLAERRADRILNKEEGYQEVLDAMGLTEDADKATILEALGVS